MKEDIQMKMIDQALSSERMRAPSPGFTASVMDAVRAEASSSGLRFPWTRFLLGSGGSALVLGSTLAWARGGGRGMEPLLGSVWHSGPGALAAVVLAVGISLLCYRVTTVLAMGEA
ncbi:MAG TPA: hypothetical protein VN918_10915 [Myxococcaceae bacterium]|nr:hypothetical protein [Myxococcaceae bacterium]